MTAIRGLCAIAAGPFLAFALTAEAGAQAPIVQPGAPGEAGRSLTAEEAETLAATGYTDADVRFMQHMRVHHAQAVEMNALIEGRTGHAGIVMTGERIALAQEAEIALMETWLARRGEPLEAPDLHAHHGHHGHHAQPHGAPSDMPLMPGMLSPAQMAALRAASGAEFDLLFLSGMIQHHQGAIDMVDALLSQPRSGQDPVLSEFIGGIVADQSAEINRMQAMLDAIRAGEPSGEETR